MGIGITWEVLKAFVSAISAPGASFYSTTEAMLCDSERKFTLGVPVFWYYIFFLSKFYELFDTVIIALKKNSIIFLHVYHHCITVVLVYVMMANHVAVSWVAMSANSMVHVPMYFYYGISALGMNAWWKKYITLLQIIQFVADLLANFVGFAYHYTGHNCSGPLWAWWFGQGILFSFLLLFLQFYASSYKRGSDHKGKEAHSNGHSSKNAGASNGVDSKKKN